MRLSVENRPLKITHSYEYTMENKQVKLSFSKNTILLPVFDDRRDIQIGFLLEGPLGVIGDLLVHSKEGAVGEIIEETYSSALFLPAKLPFLSFDHVKEIRPLENIDKYEAKLQDFKIHFKYDERFPGMKEEGILISTNKPKHLWLIIQNATFFLKCSEIIGRRGEKKLVWLSKNEILTVKEDGTLKSSKDLFSVRKAKDYFDRFIEVPLGIMFSRFRELFTSF